jgi:hypothetical protein
MQSDYEQDADEQDVPSLWQDLVQGRAGVGVRIVIAVVALVVYIGLALIGSYFFAALFPRWSRNYFGNYGSVRYVRPSDGLVAAMIALAGVSWLATVLWLFLSRSRRRASVSPVLQTTGVTVAAVILSVMADDSLRGASELVIAGIIMIAIAVVILIWTQAIRRGNRGRPLRNRQDQLPDLRCPECGYRMVGLTESRCPECGTGYTLDELVAKQGFARPARTAPSTVPPPPPPPPGSTFQPV